MQALLKPKEVAEILRVHPITIKRWAEAGRIEVVWLPNRRFLVPASQVSRLSGEHDGLTPAPAE